MKDYIVKIDIEGYFNTTIKANTPQDAGRIARQIYKPGRPVRVFITRVPALEISTEKIKKKISL